MKSNQQLLADIERYGSRSLIVGVAAFVVCILDALFHPQQFFRSYLFAYIFWIGFPLGGLGTVMIHHLTGGLWGLPIRRPLEAASRTLPLMAILFLPIVFGIPRLYQWAQPAAVNADPTLRYQHPYMNDWAFVLRAIFYFALWILSAYLINLWSREQDRTGDPRLARRLEAFSGPGLIIFGLTITFGSIDWIMSIESGWYSTIFGLLFIVVQTLVALAFGVWIAQRFAAYEPLGSYVTPQQFNDLGNLLLTFVMLWAYLEFSQFLIIWSGNLKDEIPWFLSRVRGAWAGFAVFLIIFHFFVPFFMLLMRRIKRQMKTIARVAGLLMLATLVDVYWLVVPSFDRTGPHLHLLDFLAPVAIGGVWLAEFFRQVKSQSLTPVHDPDLGEAYAHGD